MVIVGVVAAGVVAASVVAASVVVAGVVVAGVVAACVVAIPGVAAQASLTFHTNTMLARKPRMVTLSITLGLSRRFKGDSKERKRFQGDWKGRRNRVAAYRLRGANGRRVSYVWECGSQCCGLAVGFQNGVPGHLEGIAWP